ncbi:MAG: glycosyltransferase family 2 protein [Christensenellales bacterium]|jgi:glycosyltransferase involved in cell wall biosynthesis
MKNNPHISIVIPLYNCAGCIYELYHRLVSTLENQIHNNFEIILVNDASPQNDWELVKELAIKDRRVKGINFSRNFGQHHAITAGLDYAQGDWVVVMDGDLQDPPEEIAKLYSKAQEGFDVVFGRRYDRKDNVHKKLMSKLFHRAFDYLSDRPTDETVANFSICSGEVIKSFQLLREQNRSYPDFIRWMGYKTIYVDIEHAHRPVGETSYSFRKKVQLATQTIVAHSNKPLRISIGFGFTIALISLIYGIWLVLRYLLLAQPPAGWTSVMVSIYFIGGLLLANLGVLGLYIGKVFDETKNRPLYLIKEKINV